MLSVTTSFVSFVVNGREKMIPREWWDSLYGAKPPHNFECNGCTAAPDRWRGIEIWPACVIHDWHYDPECDVDVSRPVADAILGINVQRLARLQGAGRLRAAFYGSLYAAGTLLFGEPFYRPEQ